MEKKTRKAPGTQIPAKPIDPLILQRGDLLTARSVLIRHAEIIAQASAERMTPPSMPKARADALKEAKKGMLIVKDAIEMILEGWRPAP